MRVIRPLGFEYWSNMSEEKMSNARAERYSSLERAWKLYKNDGDLESRDFIIKSYTPLVESTARRIYAKRPWIFDFEDLKQAGMIGLVNAVERYDPERGILFGTYAPMRIVGSIYDEINSMDWTPRAMRQKIRKTILAIQKIEGAGSGTPSQERVAEEAGISKEDVNIAMQHASMTHVSAMDNATVSSLENNSAGTKFVSSASAIYADMNLATEQIHQKMEIARALAQVCTEEEIDVLLLHFYEEKTLKQVGEALGFSSSKVSSLKRSALDKLSKTLRKEDWTL